ncbi:NADPH-dependent F420 reductase [Paeniglutamicibacter psychrophenolicus]|uniref:NADPH-dependent F420 reductase n=1 Tax=Paeniglutamicibacter psychrophenolicus TaxID=257454 RepID=UPI0027821C64|nr:NAD(P)-binding domain-containing protein [Paeniglutamicibacter psychrophenolicus]MDQ0093223.1 putative dinucleotide-binding enzyme [Paeniglutamicibacter psychrophenolicus]
MDIGAQAHTASRGTIGILGAGRVGTAIARLAVAAGYRVKIATSKPAAENALIIEIVTPGAEAVDAAEASGSDLVVVAVPLHKYKSVNADALAGRVVVDAMNYWSVTDGDIADFEADDRSSSEVVAAHLSASRVVKSFNHIGYHEMEPDSAAPGAADRRALAIASNDAAATEQVAAFIDALGFDAVDAGNLASGRAFEPGTDVFNGRFNADELSVKLHTSLVAA